MAKFMSKSRVYIGQGVAPATPPGSDTFDSIGNVTATSGPEFNKSDVEHTDMESTLKEFFGDLADAGSLNFTCNANIGNAGQDAAFSDAQANIQRNIKVERLDPADDSVLRTYDFIGEVMEWNEDSTQGSPYTITGRIKISGAVTKT